MREKGVNWCIYIIIYIYKLNKSLVSAPSGRLQAARASMALIGKISLLRLSHWDAKSNLEHWSKAMQIRLCKWHVDWLLTCVSICFHVYLKVNQNSVWKWLFRSLSNSSGSWPCHPHRWHPFRCPTCSNLLQRIPMCSNLPSVAVSKQIPV